MAQATIYLKETDRRGHVIIEVTLCQSCRDEHRTITQLRSGERRDEKPWTGAPRECSWCGDDIHSDFLPGVCNR